MLKLNFVSRRLTEFYRAHDRPDPLMFRPSSKISEKTYYKIDGNFFPAFEEARARVTWGEGRVSEKGEGEKGEDENQFYLSVFSGS